jgi:hypothetical protein
LDFSVAEDARENPLVVWHIRHGLSAPCRDQSWRRHTRWSAIRSAFVQEQLGNMDGQHCQDRPENCARQLDWKNPQIMLDRYAPVVTDEMVAAQGVFWKVVE